MSLVARALQSGKRVVIAYTFRPIEDALRGVLERSKTEGRTVPIDMMIHTHTGAAMTVSLLHERYADHPRITFQFIDNSAPQSRNGSIALTRKQNYSEIREKLHAILESERSELPDALYRLTRGSPGHR